MSALYSPDSSSRQDSVGAKKEMAKGIPAVALTASFLILTGCASAPPYVIPEGAERAHIDVVSPQGYQYVEVATYSETENCVGRQFFGGERENKSVNTLEIEAGRELVLSVFISKEKVYGHSCNYSLIITPEPDNSYKIATLLDTEQRVCNSKISNETDEQDIPDVKIIDALLLGMSNNSAFCEGISGSRVEDLEDIETGLYHYDIYQALMYDYTPRRLEPK